MAHKVYWEFKREELGYEYDQRTLEERINTAYNINSQIIAANAKTYKDVEVGNAQIKQLEAAARELNELADKHNWDKETYRKEVEKMIERWENQTCAYRDWETIMLHQKKQRKQYLNQTS